MTLLERIQNHPGFESIHEEDPDNWGEDNNGHDYWVYLKEGWISPDMECGSIHENTLQKVWMYMKDVRKQTKEEWKSQFFEWDETNPIHHYPWENDIEIPKVNTMDLLLGKK